MQEDNELRDVALAFYEAVATGDGEALRTMASDEPGFLFIGTAPEEWWDSHDDFVQAGLDQHDQAPDISVRAGELTAFSEGDFGIVADTPVFVLPDGTETPFRLTAVARRTGEGWRFVQGHTSLGVSNQQVLGQELQG